MRNTRTNSNLRHADLTRLVTVIRDPYNHGITLPADMIPAEWIPLWELQLFLWTTFTQASRWGRLKIASEDKRRVGSRVYFRRSAVEAALAKEYRCPTCKRLYPGRRLRHVLPQNISPSSSQPSTNS